MPKTEKGPYMERLGQNDAGGDWNTSRLHASRVYITYNMFEKFRKQRFCILLDPAP